MKASSLRIQIILLFIVLPFMIFAQGKQGNNWYFADHAGMTFNFGTPPQKLFDGQLYGRIGVTSMSDENGNLLFYGDDNTIWNSEHDTMLNGNDVGNHNFYPGLQIMAIPVPGSSYLFYYFTFSGDTLQYSTINMNLDNGKGGVIPFTKKTPLMQGALPVVTAVHHKNQTDIWLVARRGGRTWHSYKITSTGIEGPFVSLVGSNYSSQDNSWPHIKLSPNGKRLAGTVVNYPIQFCEILDFDSETGIISDENLVHIDFNSSNTKNLEFSPNSSVLYVKDYSELYQYNLNAGSPQQIIMSKVSVPINNHGFGELQLAPDGKIYFPRGWEYMSVIHNPNVVGLGCNYESDYIHFGNSLRGYYLPCILPSFLREYEFESEQYCSGNPTQFNFVSTNGIDSVYWKFSDFANAPHDTSTLLNPSYTYSGPGTYYSKVTIYSGNWPPKVLIDTITIIASPDPDLGNDTSYCAGEIIDMPLDAGPGELFAWNDIPGGTQTYAVTAPGTYWVEVTDQGCIGWDTINIFQYSEPVIDTSNYSTTKANCGDSIGSITGILVIGDNVGYHWKASDGSIVSDSLDLTNMPPGIYSLHITYGNNCTIDSIPFEIQSTDGPQINGILPSPDYCHSGNGVLTVDAVTNTGTPLLYSLDGTNFTTSSTFSGLPGDTYTVIVKDVNGCTDASSIVVENLGGPIVLDSIATDENGFNANGSITIVAEGDSLYYSILGIDLPQSSGTFTGLSANTYTVLIKDKWGCERLVTMNIERINGIILSATAGDDYKCKKELAYSTLTADNFVNVKEYKAVLGYDYSNLNCTGYHPTTEFPDVRVTDFAGRVEVDWQSTVPKTLTGSIPLVDLIFETIEWGTSDIKWDTAYSIFKDEYGFIIQSSLVPGVIIVNDPPVLENQSEKTKFCEGEKAQLLVSRSGGTSPFDIQWQIPANGTISDTTLVIDSILLNQAGNYTIRVKDYNNCVDSLEIPVTVYPLPTADFPSLSDTIFFEQQTTLSATQGYAEYLWNTGETTYYITVAGEGKYSVLMQTKEGCKNIESVIMLDNYVLIKVPNAFTPNGDGLNDIFRPLVDTEKVKQYSISIYNQWGQRIFGSVDPKTGWDGKNGQIGVYNWVINYSNRVGKVFQMKGNVSLIR
jgi:gliding motility-associated-like protein